MKDLEIFIQRLKKINIDVLLIGNFPWVYLDTVNGKKVKGTYLSEHGFTAFFPSITDKDRFEMTDISTVFNKIRQTLKQ